MTEFQKVRLGDFIEILTDYHANGSYEVLEKNIKLKRNPDFAVMIRTLNFERSDFKDQLIYLNKTEYEYLSKTKVYPDDILMNKIANPGTVYLMPDLKKPVSLAMNLFLIRFNSKMNQKYRKSMTRWMVLNTFTKTMRDTRSLRCTLILICQSLLRIVMD